MANPVAPTKSSASILTSSPGMTAWPIEARNWSIFQRFRGKHEMIVNLWPDAAVWKHDLGDQLDHLIAVLAQLLDRVGNLDLIDSRFNEECSAAFWFFLFV
jgi:hypothetical protein